jgi:hypothetical protein
MSVPNFPRLIFLTSIAIAAEDPNHIPLIMLRNVERHLIPALASSRDTLRVLFGKDIEISYDLRAILNILTLPQNLVELERRDYWFEDILERNIPEELVQYFGAAVSKLRSLNFHRDDLYKSEWLKAAPKGILFEVVGNLKSGTVSPVLFQTAASFIHYE